MVLMAKKLKLFLVAVIISWGRNQFGQLGLENIGGLISFLKKESELFG